MSDGKHETAPTAVHRNSWATVAWSLNVFLLLAICAWIVCDCESFADVRSLGRRIKLGLVVAALGTIAFSFCFILQALFTGPSRYRSVRGWLAFTALVSAWCAVFVSQESLYWLGQTIRSWGDVPAYEPLVTELRDHWPAEEHEAFELGNFTAYPLGAPRTLLMVGSVKVPGAAPIAAIERSENGAIRLQLATQTGGDLWVEWHPEGSAPASFVDGVETEYSLLKQTELRPGWYLVCYRRSAQQYED